MQGGATVPLQPDGTVAPFGGGGAPAVPFAPDSDEWVDVLPWWIDGRCAPLHRRSTQLLCHWRCKPASQTNAPLLGSEDSRGLGRRHHGWAPATAPRADQWEDWNLGAEP